MHVHAGIPHPQSRPSPEHTSLEQIPPRETATAVEDTHPTGMHSCYRPQRSWGKVMFLQASVILLTGGYLTPPRADPPGGRHPPGAGSRPPPLGTDPPGQHAVRYGQRAGGMHPTGMQSC